VKTLRWLLVAAVVLMTAAAVVFVGRGLWVSRQVADAQDQALADLTAGLPAGRADAERDLDALVQAARAGEPSHMWRELVCEVDNQDAGMFLVDYYYQRCFLHSVAVIPAVEHDADTNYCERRPVPRRVRFSGNALITIARPDEVGDCAAGTLELAFQIESRASRPLEGSAATLSELQASPYWVVVVANTEVSKTELGCAPWKVLFCEVPVGAPVIDAGPAGLRPVGSLRARAGRQWRALSRAGGPPPGIVDNDLVGEFTTGAHVSNELMRQPHLMLAHVVRQTLGPYVDTVRQL